MISLSTVAKLYHNNKYCGTIMERWSDYYHFHQRGSQKPVDQMVTGFFI